jgi:hypothetical protein
MNTINYKGFDFQYKLDYQPAERQTLEYSGCGEEFEIYNITLNGVDASELLENQIEEFEEFIINKLKNNYDPY